LILISTFLCRESASFISQLLAVWATVAALRKLNQWEGCPTRRQPVYIPAMREATPIDLKEVMAFFLVAMPMGSLILWSALGILDVCSEMRISQ
jgi:hypothetical protein